MAKYLLVLGLDLALLRVRSQPRNLGIFKNQQSLDTDVQNWTELIANSEVALSGPEFTTQYFIYYVRKLPVWVL